MPMPDLDALSDKKLGDIAWMAATEYDALDSAEKGFRRAAAAVREATIAALAEQAADPEALVAEIQAIDRRTTGIHRIGDSEAREIVRAVAARLAAKHAAEVAGLREALGEAKGALCALVYIDTS